MFENYVKTAPNKNYVKFFQKMEDMNSLDIKEWNYIQLIGYFVSKYKNTYNKDYKFKYDKQTTSDCYEAFRMRSCFQHISSDPVIMKSYIDWVFEKIAKRKITSIIVLVKEEYMIEYKMKFLFNQNSSTISRTTPLPDNYINILKSNNYDLSTYGDLVFLYNADNVIASELLNKLPDFDKSILDKII